ncbi:polyphosphate kinase 2 family protein [Rhodovibrio salinarum]|uniref:Polyphosphate kinase-2-related domain-containing protein n=1 Tax=Rhodovibrio salinarum TaxID=1087 RepID=A0A934QIX9_9PROT|nr:hypothetical protein [Rhodovibrio salinarum]MBK1697562.1 hypothetical protein [Rhodovibrio salinarum]
MTGGSGDTRREHDLVQEVPGPETRFADLPTRHARDDSRGYTQALIESQHDLRRLQLAQLAHRSRGVVVMEGWDASGKGGIIRRMAAVLEPRAARFHPIGPPTAEWQNKHWLARFWPLLPDPGAMAVFDRSWYGRVLVERVEGLTPEVDWRRGFEEIRQFEEMLLNDGVRLVKIFLNVSPRVQLHRFQKRLDDPVKRWKLGVADLRNWELRAPYEAAIEEMLQRTSTTRAPWHVIPADDKKYARVRAMQLIFEGLSDGLEMTPPRLDPEVAGMAESRLGLHVPEEVQTDAKPA